MRGVFLVCMSLGVCAQVMAEEVTDCLAAGNTLEQNECFSAQIDNADKKLNRTYQRLIRLVRNHGEEWVNDLRSAQRKWIEFRDLNCEFYGNYLKGGTGAGTYYGDCIHSMTIARENELRVEADLLTARGYKEVSTPNKPLEPTR